MSISTSVLIYERLATGCSAVLCCFNAFILYTLLLHRKGELKGSFFSLFTILGLIDLARATAWIFGVDFARWGWFETIFHNNWLLATFTTVVTNYGIQLSRCLNFCLAVNRLYAMARPFQYVQRWNDSMVRKCIVGSVGAACLLFGHHIYVLLVYGANYRAVTFVANVTSHFMILNNPPLRVFVIWMSINSVEGIATAVSYVVIYSCTFYFARKGHQAAKKNQVNNNELEKFKREFNLVLCMSVLASFQVIYSIYMLFVAVIPHILFVNYYLYYARGLLIVQLDALANPILLVSMSSKLRKCLGKAPA